MRICTFADRAAMEAQADAIDTYYMRLARRVARGRAAPPDPTTGYCYRCQFGDGAWGHGVDDFIRNLHGVRVGNHVIDVSAERDNPPVAFIHRGVTMVGPYILQDVPPSRRGRGRVVP